MNEYEPNNPSPETKAREALADVITNVDYKRYSAEKSALPVSKLNPDVVRGDEFGRVFQKYHWPDKADADAIRPVLSYEDDADFLYHLRVYPDTNNAEQNRKYLNNFNVLLRTPPVEEFDLANMEQSLYGMQPVLHRGYAIAPDLFSNVQTFFEQAHSAYRGNPDELTRYLAQEQNADVIAAAHMCYRILGRLFKYEDMFVQSQRMFGNTKGARPIYNAHDALTV